MAFLDADSPAANEQKSEQRYETAFVSLPYRRRISTVSEKLENRKISLAMRSEPQGRSVLISRPSGPCSQHAREPCALQVNTQTYSRHRNAPSQVGPVRVTVVCLNIAYFSRYCNLKILLTFIKSKIVYSNQFISICDRTIEFT